MDTLQRANGTLTYRDLFKRKLSQIEILDERENLDLELTYKAVITSLPLPPLKVYFTGEEEGINIARKELKTANFQRPSLYICID